ncbi:ABC transporter substrate-binding protein [Brucella intermedia]|uniref:ABC transporter substrate-binding protein n=1 Tax=Brucella intermedia TaxID=94625 RepID=UPI00224A5E1C|nr:ABC transporter substrate-binding protein [Brucella intermedia]
MPITRRTFLTSLTAGAVLPWLPGGQVLAAEPDGELVIGFSTAPTSLDPHWHLVAQNNALAQHIYDRITHIRADQAVVPGLAENWRTIDDLTWEFTLRDGVKFQDGTPLSIEDIIFTVERAQNVPGAIFNMRSYLTGKVLEKVNDRVFFVKTEKPNPIVPDELATTAIISRKYGEGATTDDYNSGRAAIGTGPYRVVQADLGNRIVLERNDAYWGPRPAFARVIIRPIPVGGARVAALRAGDVGLIDNVPPSDVATLEKAEGFSLARGIPNRTIFLALDQERESTPFVRGKDGGEIPNPFRDLRVRQAFSLAIDRKAISERILSGNGVPAVQLAPEKVFGAAPDLKLPAVDIDRAKALLAEAGLPDGFKVTLHGPNDRFIRDAAVVQAAAQMLARIGVDVEVETMPASVFYQRATSGGANGDSAYSFFLVGYGASMGDIAPALRNVIHTVDKKRGYGANNRLHYSNPAIDEILEKAMVTMDSERRATLYAEASRRAMEDIAVIPLYHPITVWGLRNPLRFPGRDDERTLAMDVQG